MERQVYRDSWLSVPRRREAERLDPHVYEQGVNGLTVDEATGRALPRVMGILERSGERYSEFERSLVGQEIRACLISQVSRANLYRIAGILVADRRDEGAHPGTSLALAYVAALREAFLRELSVGERVRTPAGTGEVRYVSSDGASAVVELHSPGDVSGNPGGEVWLQTANVSRLGEAGPEDPGLLRAS
jgi:hypothetical protein